jgi:hypothetical protein
VKLSPPRQGEKSFPQHQAEMAEWAGYGSDVKALNAEHDDLHRDLCAWLGVESHSMLCAEGKPHDPDLAAYEEAAVLATQRFRQMCRIRTPDDGLEHRRTMA